ncbi:PucR family transcriptional regulator [Streptomyces sp. NPDC059477]|uniref:PucR family transcriptional regulator n=1 Tax=Streptomyces sp. NPDC059477 TaxID=3346847 RepID=UPI003695CB24
MDRAGDSPTARLGRDLGCRLLLLDTATAHPVDPEGVAPEPALRQALLTAVNDHNGRIPGVLHLSVPGGSGSRGSGSERSGSEGSGSGGSGERAGLGAAGVSNVLAVEVPAEEPTVLVAVELPGMDTSLLHHLATAAAVETARQGMLREHERRLGSELLAQLLDARVDPHAAREELAAHRLPPDDLVVLAVPQENGAEQRDLHLALSRRRVPHLLLNRSDLLLALLSDSPGDLSAVHRRLGLRTPIGLSSRTSLDRLSEARDEAVWSLSLARSSAGGLVRYGDDTAFTVLRSHEEARAIVERVLGPLTAYDRANGTDLVGTLRSFLVNRRSWQRTAAALNVHKQTVMYRVQRVEELTDRRLAETADITELWIAFQAHALLRGDVLR